MHNIREVNPQYKRTDCMVKKLRLTSAFLGKRFSGSDTPMGDLLPFTTSEVVS